MREGSISRCPLTLPFLVRELIARFLLTLTLLGLVTDLFAVWFSVDEILFFLATGFSGVALELAEVWAKLVRKVGEVSARVIIKMLEIMMLNNLLMNAKPAIMGSLYPSSGYLSNTSSN